MEVAEILTFIITGILFFMIILFATVSNISTNSEQDSLFQQKNEDSNLEETKTGNSPELQYVGLDSVYDESD